MRWHRVEPPSWHRDAYAALTGTAAWPGPALLWMDVQGTSAVLRAFPPRGIRVGR